MGKGLRNLGVLDGEQNPLANQIVWIIDPAMGCCFWCSGPQNAWGCSSFFKMCNHGRCGTGGGQSGPAGAWCFDLCWRWMWQTSSPDYPPLRWTTRNVAAAHPRSLGSWVTGDLGCFDCDGRWEACADHLVEALLNVPGEGGHHTRRREGGLRSLNIALLRELLWKRIWFDVSGIWVKRESEIQTLKTRPIKPDESSTT